MMPSDEYRKGWEDALGFAGGIVGRVSMFAHLYHRTELDEIIRAALARGRYHRPFGEGGSMEFADRARRDHDRRDKCESDALMERC